MTIDTEDLLKSISLSFSKMTYIRPDDIPNIDLYMDQVTTFLDEHLKATTRIKTDDKLMTKTMINNYAKNDVIPPPEKKKYNREHILLLIMIYYYKSFLQISDIKELLDPISDVFFGKEGYGIEEVYNEIFSNKYEQLGKITEDVIHDYEEAMKTFSEAPGNSQEYLKLFAFVCNLGCEVFVKKLLIEKIVDSIKEHKKLEVNKYDIPFDKKAEKEALKAEKEAHRAEKEAAKFEK